MTSPIRPFDAKTARQIARAFLPQHWYGNRHDYCYTQIKLRTDPLYPGALTALRGSSAPVLDLGCGLGLLAHALRADGQHPPYLGVDSDVAKIKRARAIAMRSQLDDTRFEVFDLDAGLPAHAGSVVLLDVLQYLAPDRQRELLAKALTMLAPEARLVIRTCFVDATGRSQTTHISDRLAHTIGWMQQTPKQYPTRAGLLTQLKQAGLTPMVEPLHGHTPFNNWLIVAAG